MTWAESKDALWIARWKLATTTSLCECEKAAAGSGIEGKHCDVLVVIVMIQQDKSEAFFSLQWKSARLSVLQLLRFPPSPFSPQQDVFHAIVDVACWKHNETSMNPNCTSPGTRAALWDPVGGDAGSGETQLGPLHPQLTIYSWESKDKGQPCRHILAFWLLPCCYRALFMPFTFTKFILSTLQSVESQVCEGLKDRNKIVLPNPIHWW